MCPSCSPRGKGHCCPQAVTAEGGLGKGVLFSGVELVASRKRGWDLGLETCFVLRNPQRSPCPSREETGLQVPREPKPHCTWHTVLALISLVPRSFGNGPRSSSRPASWVPTRPPIGSWPPANELDPVVCGQSWSFSLNARGCRPPILSGVHSVGGTPGSMAQMFLE